MYTYIIITTTVAVGITAFIASYGARKFKTLPVEMKALTIYFAIDLCCSIASALMGFNGISNLWLLNSQIPIEYGFFIWALSFWVHRDTIAKILRYSIPVFFSIYLTLFLTIEDFSQFSTISRPILTAVMLIGSIYVLIDSLRDISVPVSRQSRFWITSGLMIYNAGNATLFLINNKLFAIPEEMLRSAWIFHNLLGIFAYFLFALGFVCQRIQQNSGGR